MNIILTGASRGIGFEIPQAFAKLLKDCNIIALSRNENKLKDLKKICQDINPTCNVIPLSIDLKSFDYDKISKVLIDNDINKIDILINNAGLLERNDFIDTGIENAIDTFNVNFFAPAKLIKNLVPSLNNPSHIVNIGSMAGFQGSQKFPGLSYYAASKAALSCLTECIAEEYKDKGISFNCLALGAVQTEMLEEAFPGFKAPLKAKEMGSYIAKFAISGQKYYNGKTLPVTLSTP